MKFEDEFRAASAVAGAKRAQVAADLDGFIVKYDGLLHGDKRNAATIAKLQKQVKELQGQVLQLNRAQTARTAELRRSKSENEKLQEKLTALRGSWRLRVGVAATAPFRWAGTAGRNLTRDLTRGDSTASDLSSIEAGPAKKEISSKPPLRAPEKVPSAADNQISLITTTKYGDEWRRLLGNAASSPTKANVLEAASFGYYTLGKVTLPLQMLLDHVELISPLTDKEGRFLKTLEGLASVSKTEFFIPPRQSNPGYQAERGRLLYCAHSVAPYNSNGYSTRTGGLVEGMTSAGLDVVVAARPGYPWDVKTDVVPDAPQSFEKSINGVTHFFSSGPSWTDDRLDHYLHHAIDSYVQVAMRTRAQTIQAASNHVTALPALIAARRLGLPFIYEVRGLWEVTKASISPQWAESEAFNLAKSLEILVATSADLVFAITDQVKEELISRGVSRERIVVLHNAVNTSLFTPMPPHMATLDKLGIPREVPVVGYAGSLVEYEGLETLLEASKLLADRGTDFRTVIVGDGASLPRLLEKSAQLDIGDKVSFVGRVSPTQVNDYISTFDVLPCPRLPLAVTEMVSPLKPLEAMAAGKAVVLSDLAPLRDLAGADGVRARLFESGNASALADVLAELIADDSQRSELGRRARLWAITERDWKQIGAKAKDAIEKTETQLSSHQASAPEPKNLSELTVAIISDPFTTAGLEPETNLVRLHPETWKDQMIVNSVDVLFVESAWEGNDGSWRGKVGFYDDESFTDLRDLVEYCRVNGVPSIFWNKEDPVHFNRFRATAKHFDHVFTSDDGSIPGYLTHAGAHLKSVASLPFYAQPALHNPLAGQMEYNHTVAYAGSFYGDRYKKRSLQLQQLLSAAIPSGLAIYDRQHLNLESPYKFPVELAPYVRGGLSYEQTVDAYKAHPVHLNVNSVENSGTMFSRRVYEISACGGAVLSGPGFGIQKMFGGIIPIADDKGTASMVIQYWMENEEARNADAWLSMRSVFRSHTAGHRLAYALRTAGLRVRAPQLEKYAVVVAHLSKEAASQLERQSVPPALVVVSEPWEKTWTTSLHIVVEPDHEAALLESGISLVGTAPTSGMDRTFFEDLLTSRKYCDWKDAVYASNGGVNRRASMAEVSMHESFSLEYGGIHALDREAPGPTIRLIRNISPTEIRPVLPQSEYPSDGLMNKQRTVLVAGHDLKFAQGIIAELQSQGHTVLMDNWLGHSEHDEEASRRLLTEADVIFCEWTLGNAVWYSKNKLPNQRLVTRLHLQEISTKYLAQVRTSAIDRFIFVGQHIANIGLRDFGIPALKSSVIPNYVRVEQLRKDKLHGAQWNIGLVGSVPQRKRLDLALDTLVMLRKNDNRYKLYVKGKSAGDYHWMKGRPEENSFYEEQNHRIANDPLLRGAVFFDGHGEDMEEWYRKIGTVLSVSDFESFHLTLADGAASGAVPVTLAWDGADQIYPAEWIHASVAEMTESIISMTSTSEDWKNAGAAASRFAELTFDQSHVLPSLASLIVGSSDKGL